MQAGKSAMESAKETMANIAASAKSGMEKTKAVVEEKVDRISTSDPVEKDMATLRKEDKIRQAELLKQEAYSQNAAAAAGGTESYTATGTIGHSERIVSRTNTMTESYTGSGRSETTTWTESYTGSGRSETKPMSDVAGHGTTISPNDHVTEGVHDAGTTVDPVGTNTETARTLVRTGPEP